jgi:hypothetical protein
MGRRGPGGAGRDAGLTGVGCNARCFNGLCGATKGDQPSHTEGRDLTVRPIGVNFAFGLQNLTHFCGRRDLRWLARRGGMVVASAQGQLGRTSRSRYIRRTLEPVLKRAAQDFPAVVLTGPRQSGKTTTLRHVFARRMRYVSLEPPDIQEVAEADPRCFLDSFPPPVIWMRSSTHLASCPPPRSG